MFVVVLGGVFLVASTAMAGPWVPELGASYSQGALGFTAASDRREYLLSHYGERGVGERLGFVYSLPLKYVDQHAPPPSGDEQRSFFALSPNLGLRWQLLDGPLVLATQADLKIPLSGGSFDLTPQLLAGASFGSLGFFQLGGGIRARSGGDAHEAIYAADVGFWLADPILLMLESRGRVQLAPDQGANLAEREHMAGGQLMWRATDEVDVGVEALYTFENDSVARAVTTTVYVAFHSQ